MDSVFFTYDGVKSEDMDVWLVNMQNGLIGETFLSEREIVSETIFGNPIPYVYGIQHKPFSLKLTIALRDGKLWTTEKRREIARWLDVRRFAEFYSADDVDKRYFLMLEGGSELFTNGAKQGYVDLTFRSISPYCYSPVYDKWYDLSSISGPKTVAFDNLGDTDLYPHEMWIEKRGNGPFQIKNLSDGGRLFAFASLQDGETVYVQNDDRHIATSLANTHRFDAFNGNYLKLVYGKNELEISGAAKIKLRYRFILKG